MRKTVINSVSYYPIKPTSKGLIGFASLTIDNKLALNAIAVYTKPDGNDVRLLFANKVLRNGAEVSIVHPVDAITYSEIKQAIIKKIKDVVKKVKGVNGDGQGARNSQ